MEHFFVEIGPEDGKLETFFLKESNVIACSHSRPLVVICPGGAYHGTCDREAEPVAMAFAAKGYHTMIVWYPTVGEKETPPRYPAALCCLAKSVAWARSHAAEYAIDPNRIAVLGFSAGGHLAGNLGVAWNTEFLRVQTGLCSQDMKPNRMVLCYPVITTGEFISPFSFQCLLGDNPTPEQLEEVSLEKRVSADTPPCFLWTTITDSGVPVENTMLFSMALRKYNIPQEVHLFSEGEHGLALAAKASAANDGQIVPACAPWFELAYRWLDRPVVEFPAE